MRIAIKYLIIFSIVFISTNCISNYEKSDDALNKSANKKFKQLNVTILLDLSDRISQQKNPGQADKDISIILNIVDNFKKYLNVKGVALSRDRIKLVYYPLLNFPQIKDITDSLNINFENLGIIERKAVFNNIDRMYLDNLKRLYSIFSNMPEYNGSDLFSYFKHRVVDDCITLDEDYINLLVILSDGYLYSYNNKFKIENRFSYIGPLSTHLTQFRNNPHWERRFNDEDYGFIKIENDLSNLLIIAAEFNPEAKYPIDFDILKKYWSKWFEEQNVQKSNFIILRTDHISQNKNVIEAFFKKKIFSF